MQSFRARLAVAFLAGAMLAAGAIGVAWAAIPSGDALITGCYRKVTGALRVVDAQSGDKCKKQESQLVWNQQGPRGPTGATGPTGPAGVSEGFAFTKAATKVGELAQEARTVAQLSLPQGNYIVNASVSFQNIDATDASLVQCDILDPGGDRSLELTQVEARAFSSLAVTGPAILDNPGDLRLVCELGTHLQGATIAISPALTAIKVTNLSVVPG